MGRVCAACGREGATDGPYVSVNIDTQERGSEQFYYCERLGPCSRRALVREGVRLVPREDDEPRVPDFADADWIEWGDPA